MMEERLTPEQLAELKTKEDDYIVDRLIMVHMCMCFCQNLMNEVVEMVKKQGRFRFGLKNTLKNVKREINEMLGDFFHKIDQDATDEYVSNYEVFEETLRVMARLKDFDENKLTTPRETQFTKWWYNETGHTRPPMTKDVLDWADTH